MKIDFSEPFPHLTKAPIVEAVIDFRALPTVPCEQSQFETYFRKEFSEFPAFQVHNKLNYHLKAQAGKHPETVQPTSLWQGLAFHSSDKLRIAQCQRDGFSLSRLPSYPKWEEFVTEAMSLWGKYAALTKPVEILRIGVRFINRIPISAQAGNLSEYLMNAPKSWDSFPIPFASFVHSDTFSVPDTNYLIHVVRALQPPDPTSDLPAIILDTDVSTRTPSPIDTNALEGKLQEMRWLKNKVFFASITKKLQDSLL
jgi:uncharacterized protein (TIGR04255 family)